MHENSVIGYVFHHMDDISACDKIANHITNSVLGNPSKEGSRFDLYQNVVKYQWRDPHLDPYLHVSQDNLHIWTLSEDDIKVYKPLFDVHQWNTICLFEHHFGISVKNSFHSFSSIDADVERWIFLKLCNSAKELSKQLSPFCHNTIA